MKIKKVKDFSQITLNFLYCDFRLENLEKAYEKYVELIKEDDTNLQAFFYLKNLIAVSGLNIINYHTLFE